MKKKKGATSGECKNVDPDVRDFFGGGVSFTYACGNCDRCKDVDSSVSTDEVGRGG